jgi:hypothetical protein
MRTSLLFLILCLFTIIQAQDKPVKDDTSLAFILKGADYFFAGDYIKAQKDNQLR